MHKFELKIYSFLGVKKWKEKIPEAGFLSGFKKDKIYDPYDKDYLTKFLQENCIAEVLHLISAFWSFIAIIFIIPQISITISVPIAIMNFIIHIMPVLVQRFMRPRLLNLRSRVE